MAELPLVTGWLYIVDEGLIGRSWKKRWGTLTSSRLEYNKSPDESGHQNFYALDHDSVVSKEITLEPPKKSDIHLIQLRTPFGPHVVGFEKEADRENWFREIAIRIAILKRADLELRDNSDLQSVYMPPQTQEHDYLDLEIIEAAELPKMDVIGTCDAYCRLKLPPYRKVRSTVVNNRLNPVWNEDFTFILETPDPHLILEVWDADTTGDDEFVGHLNIEINKLSPGAIVDQWFDLKQRTFKDPANPGRIHLRLQRVRRTSPGEGFLAPFGIPSRIVPRRVDTGDVLLFNNQSVLSAGLRAITRSKYDHVAMVIRKWDNALTILESTSDGVCLYKFDGRLANRTTYSVAVRRLLRVERTPQMRKTVWDFVTSVRGKPYEAQTLQMINSAFKLNSKEDLTTIFCSELVAAAYFRIGILSQTANSSNNYLPADFAPEGSAHMPFLMGATLEPKVCVLLALKKATKKEKNSTVADDQRKSSVSLGVAAAPQPKPP